MPAEDMQKTEDGTLSEVAGKENEFAETLENIRKSTGMSVVEMQALMCHVPRRTIYNWLSGEAAPDAEKQRWAIERLTDPANPPSKRKRAEMLKLHNLTWDGSKERWKLRLTFSIGKKVVGQRIAVWLPTRDADQAVFGRQVALSMAKALKLEVECRKQKRKS